MSMLNLRRAGLFALVIAAAVVVLGATAYAFRARLAGAPVIGSLFRSATPEQARDEDEILYWTCPMHPHVKEHGPGKCPECGMDLVPVRVENEKVQAPAADPRAEVSIDPRRQQLIGVRTAAVESASLAKMIRTVGLVRYDETRLTDVNLKLEGWIRDLHVDYTGEFVRKGEPLFTLYSPELLTTQQEYLLALKTRDQVSRSQIADAREYADRLVESARRRVELWDLPADQLSALDETRKPQTAVTFRSPATGYVIEKQALQGMHVMPGQTLYKIANLSGVWVEADIYEREMPLVKVGQRATVTLDAYPGETFRGRAIYIYPFVVEQTRTVRVRFEFANRGGRLKPGMYANVTLETPIGRGVTIPSNALLDSGTRQMVFVAEGDGYFEPRDVKVGQRLGDRIQILDGLTEGEAVASGATFFIDSESQLRASVQGFEQAPAASGSAALRQRLDVIFRSDPDPPRSGDNLFEVTVKDPEGTPIADADVTVVFFMPAMPSMNMPAMKTETKLPPAGNGVYRGRGEVMMAGRWDVTIDVSRKSERLGRKTLTVVAR